MTKQSKIILPDSASGKKKIIIFDMDNTIIESKIDFPLMYKDVHRFLREVGIPFDDTIWISKVLADLEYHPQMTPDLWNAIWQRINDIETEGLLAAVLENNANYILDKLAGNVRMAILTNNVHQAAIDILKKLDVYHYFEVVAGRGVVPELKPSPNGMLYILDKAQGVTPPEAMSIGDAINDGCAATAAGIDFIAYNTSHIENWQRAPYAPMHYLRGWNEDSLQMLMSFIK